MESDRHSDNSIRGVTGCGPMRVKDNAHRR